MHPIRETITATARKMARVYYQTVGHYSVRVNDVHLRCDPFHFRFWRHVNRGTWENNSFAVLDHYLHPDAVYLDIGAWIGPTVLYAAHRCQTVYCIEPDYTAYRYLLFNLDLNKLHNVRPFNLALSNEAGIREMTAPNGNLGESYTSLVRRRPGDTTVQVYCLGWSEWHQTVGSPNIDLIKIDIEGGEFTLIPAMRDYLETCKPPVYLSLHPTFLDKGDRKAAMARIVDVMSIYSTCLDSTLRPFDPAKLVTDAALEELQACVFVNG